MDADGLDEGAFVAEAGAGCGAVADAAGLAEDGLAGGEFVAEADGRLLDTAAAVAVAVDEADASGDPPWDWAVVVEAVPAAPPAEG